MDELSRREAWLGLLYGEHRPVADGVISTAFRIAETGCRPFLGMSNDGRRYWVKHPGNAHGLKSLVSERVVAAVGVKIGAPVMPSRLLEIPKEVASIDWLRLRGVSAGLGHCSELVEPAFESTQLSFVSKDGNSRRQAKLIGLWELLEGCDEQWLYATGDDFMVWSFDHGFWMFGGEPGQDGGWVGPALEPLVESTARWTGSLRGLDASAFLEVAAAIDGLSVEELIACVATVPVEWNVPDDDLESLAWWIYCRRGRVSRRMRSFASEVGRG
ncbi:hypothetical protein ODZ83_10775 [Acaricomes phytoseiuli]|uniref:HipA family kinase n=1 Tax=Acaricomes phytoseiuli TaxID=291968 RepID=UPI002221692B|nr:HipA family kinase [Acaricomes phytoseiuli]MCW1250646.1 hypothetical protein [Acaricomes phytoseiuli]